MRSMILITAVAVPLWLSACSPTPPMTASAGAEESLATSYKLGAGDKFRLIVFNEPTLSGQEFQVNSDGDASLPLIGPVHVTGMTTRAAEEMITGRYAAGFLKNPKVNIDITDFRPFYILGEVKKPGEYPYANGMTVLNAAALAEGFTYRANTKRVYIRHNGGGPEQIVPLVANTPVLPGDTVRIVERFF